MKLYVNFQNFDQLALEFLREGISRSREIHDRHWIEWDEKLHESPPDISLIYANDVSWREVVQLSNLAPGNWVVLVGNRSPQVGLPIVDSSFKWTDLPQFAGIKEMTAGATCHPPRSARFALTLPGSLTPDGSLQP